MLREDLRTVRRRTQAILDWIIAQRRAHFTLAALRETGLWLIGAGLLLPASMARLTAGMSPFAPALFSAGIAAGLSPFSMLLGCAVAAAVGPFSPASLAPLIGCLAAWGMAIGLQLLLTLEPADREGREVRMAACAAVGALLPALIMAQGVLYNYLAACASGVISAAVAPVVYPALSLRAERERLLPDEKLALFACAAALMLGLCALPGALRHTSLLLGLGCILIFARSGAASGALGGLCTGLALRFAGLDTLFCALMPLGGALAGALSPISRPASAGGLIVASVLTGAWYFGIQNCLPEFACSVLAGAAYSFLPERLLNCLSSAPDGLIESERRALQRQRDDLRRRLDSLSCVFGELSSGYAQTGRALPTEAEMVGQLREKLCANCPSYASCWSEGSGAAGRLLCQLLGLAFSGALLGEDSELPPELGRQCRRAGQIPRRVGPLLADYDARRRAELKRDRLTSLMSAQFDQSRALLAEAAQSIQSGGQPDPALASVARAAFEKEGIRAEYLYALGGEQPEICARLTKKPGPTALREVARLISEEVGIDFEAAISPSLGLRIAPQPPLRLQIGFRSVPGSESCLNGDSRIAQRLPDGRVLIALSDGMGSGETAGRESSETLRLISRFLQAGIEPASAIDAINELMLLRSGEDMYSTVDLCLIDAGGSTAELIKLGACRSYLLRGGACIRLESGRLPLGILEEVRPVRRSVPLHRGDLLVLATDGLECGDEDEWIASLLRDMAGKPPQQIADALVQEALRQSRAHADDTTVLAVRVA